MWIEAVQNADGPIVEVDQVLERLKAWNLIDESVEKKAIRGVPQDSLITLKLKQE